MSPQLPVTKPPTLCVRKKAADLSLTASGSTRLRWRKTRPYLSFRGSCTGGSRGKPLSRHAHLPRERSPPSHTVLNGLSYPSRTDRGGPPKLSRDQLGSRNTDSLSGDECWDLPFYSQITARKISQPPIFPTDDSLQCCVR